MRFGRQTLFPRIAAVVAAVAIAACIGFGCAHKSEGGSQAAGSAGQLEFASPDEAVNALVAGVSAHDPQRMAKVLGPDGQDVLNSGDEVADRQSADRFLDAYAAKHQIVTNPDGSATLVIGAKDWPMPIPIVKNSSTGAWSFDTATGKDEIINRRIGRNELNSIEVCKAICDAERDYAELDRSSQGLPVYTPKMISDPGTRNGLYWPTQPGEAPSPLGELAGEAAKEGYAVTPTTVARPYHGYFYHILTSQGPNAPGGAINYAVNGKLVGGFGIVAWPADYGNSGVMTFISNYKGDVFQKDLGEQTETLASQIKSFDPDASWKKAE